MTNRANKYGAAGVLLLAIVFNGCERAPIKRQYVEKFVDAEKSSAPVNDPHAFMQSMPQDAIHANLRQDGMQNMPVDPSLEASVDRSPLKWTTPQGWMEKQGSGMRLASFNSTGQDAIIETTIISLGGKAGGLNSNVIRWLQQINIEAPSTEDLETFISKQERFTNNAGLVVTIIDLSLLQKEADEKTPSMIAAVIDREESQIFVKMTGTIAAVNAQRKNFNSLLRSIEPVETP